MPAATVRPHKPLASATESAPASTKLNPFDLYAGLRRDVETLANLTRGVLLSADRHGDFQAMLTTANRIPEKLKQLLEAEEVH